MDELDKITDSKKTRKQKLMQEMSKELLGWKPHRPHSSDEEAPADFSIKSGEEDEEGMDIFHSSSDSEDMVPDYTQSEESDPEQLKMTHAEWKDLQVDTLIAKHEAEGCPEEDDEAFKAAIAEAEAAHPIPDALADYLEKEKEDPEHFPEEMHEEAKEQWRAQMKKEIDEMNEDSEEEGYLELTEEALEDFLNKVEQQIFYTEEEAEKWIDANYHKFITKRVQMFRHRGRNWRNDRTDLEKQFFSRTQIESKYDGDLVLSETQKRQFLEQVDDTIGRYPHGWRHYESFVNYKVVNPDAVIDDYIQEMNSQVTFDNFLAIMRQSAIEKIEHDPAEKNKMAQEVRNLEEDNESEGAPTIYPKEAIHSDFFEQEARLLYNEKTQDMLVKGKWFTLVDALNDHLDMVHHGKNRWDFPLHNTYIPVRHTILKKPSMVDGLSDDLGYHYGKVGQNNSTYDGLDLHPFKPNQPLKAYRMASPPVERNDFPRHNMSGRPYRKTMHKHRFSVPRNQYGRQRYMFSTSVDVCAPVCNVAAVRKYFADWGHQF